MEALLQYAWKHKLFPLKPLTTTDGQPVDVLDPGIQNRDAGPDFFNAKVRIGGILWVGNVEVHQKSSQWAQHGHDIDGRYDNVVLHVTGEADADVETSDGKLVPQMVLEVPRKMLDDYESLLRSDHYPPCHEAIPTLPRLTARSWLDSLAAERLEQKTAAIGQRVHRCDGSWEAALFVTMARNYGFGVNGDAFEQWAYNIPLQSAAHHRDDLFQIEALFLGQAGLLDPQSIPPRHREEAEADAYFQRLKAEYAYLSHKFGLKPMDGSVWKFLRLRPQNFPYIRISQLARLYCSRRSDLSRLAECTSADDARLLLHTSATDYWQTHYTFGGVGRRSLKAVSGASLDLLVINTVAPMLFAYGRHKADEGLCRRAMDMLASLKAEDNHIVRMWKQCGLEAETAADSQALIQLKREYCDRKDCLRCRFGYEVIKKVKR